MKIILDESDGINQKLVDDLHKFMDELTNDPNNLVTDVEVNYDEKVLMYMYWDIDTENPKNVCRYRGSNKELFDELKLITPIKQ